MANTKSAKKAIRSSARKNKVNVSWKKRLLKSKKGFEAIISKPKTDVAVAKKLLGEVKKVADKAVTHGSLAKNKSSKIKSRLDKRFLVWAKS